MSQPVKAVVSRRFTTSAESIFAAWLDPEWIGRWMVGPEVRDERIVRLSVEPRVGGKFSFVVNRKGMEIDQVGEYLEVDRPHLLVFTWGIRDSRPATSRVVVEISPLDNGCELTLTHVMDSNWTAFADKAAGVWHTRLGVLDRALTETKTLTLNPT